MTATLTIIIIALAITAAFLLNDNTSLRSSLRSSATKLKEAQANEQALRDREHTLLKDIFILTDPVADFVSLSKPIAYYRHQKKMKETNRAAKEQLELIKELMIGKVIERVEKDVLDTKQTGER